MEMANRRSRIIIVLLLAFLLTPLLSLDAFAQHGHEPPTAVVGNRTLTVSLSIDPMTGGASEYSGRLKLVDVNTNSTVPHVTYFVTISKEGKVLMKEWFHDHEGDLPFKIKPKGVSKITVYGEQEPTLNGYMKRGNNPVVIEGPLLMTDGIYNFTIEIFSIDNDKTILNDPIKYEVNVPIGKQEDEMQGGMVMHGMQTVAGLHVELHTDPGTLEPDIPVKFWFQITDAATGKPLDKVPHDFVLISNGKEIFREFKDSPSYIHEYKFTKEQTGSLTVKLENLNNSGEDIEFVSTVVPEFPFAFIIAPVAIGLMVTLVRLKSLFSSKS